MEINFGTLVPTKAQRATFGNTPFPVKWVESELINGHILLAGASGTGKTHNIRKIVSSMINESSRPIRVHVFDVHDDIEIPGASEVYFSEASEYGLNPLEIDSDMHTGGVRKSIQNFISTLNKTSRQLGDRQESVLRSLLIDLYAANGFFIDDPKSWVLNDGVPRKYKKKYPNIDDLYRMSAYKYKAMFIGGDSKTAGALDRVNKASTKMQKVYKEDPHAESSDDMAKLKNTAIDAYRDYVLAIKSGREIDELIRYDSKTTLKSVVDRIENLKSCGVFRKESPNFDLNTPVWRYRLKTLSSDEKKMFVHFRLKELYDNAIKRGVQEHIVEVIVLDEANMFMTSADDNIISIMANEIRKFGTALVCASQMFSHFSTDFLGSVGTKIILGLDELYWEKTSRQLQLDKKLLDWIIPRRSALIQIKRSSVSNDIFSKIKWMPTELK